MPARITAILAMTAAFGLLLAALVIGGNASSFLDARAGLIVLGGTLAITLISFSPVEIATAVAEVWHALFDHRERPRATADRLLKVAERAKLEGMLGVERALPQLRRDPFLMRALTMLVDGVTVDEVERVLEEERAATAQRRASSAEVLRRAADVAPAMGLIGTLVGLVQMLGALDDPSAIGPAMAVALLTTFYGAVLGTMVLNPLAAKLERTSSEERRLLALYAAGAAAIGRQEHPRQLEIVLNALLPPAERVQYSR